LEKKRVFLTANQNEGQGRVQKNKLASNVETGTREGRCWGGGGLAMKNFFGVEAGQ